MLLGIVTLLLALLLPPMLTRRRKPGSPADRCVAEVDVAPLVPAANLGSAPASSESPPSDNLLMSGFLVNRLPLIEDGPAWKLAIFLIPPLSGVEGNIGEEGPCGKASLPSRDLCRGIRGWPPLLPPNPL